MKHQRFLLLFVSLSRSSAAAAAVRVPPLFVTSDRCQACHNGLVTARRRGRLDRRRLAGLDDGQRRPGPILAGVHPPRDPGQPEDRRGRRARVLGLPHAHGPLSGQGGRRHGAGLRPSSRRLPQTARQAALAIDGVSCTVCHQIGRGKARSKRELLGRFCRRHARRPDRVAPDLRPLRYRRRGGGRRCSPRPASRPRRPTTSEARSSAPPAIRSSPTPSTRRAKSSAGCRNRSPTSNGSTAAITERWSASLATCPRSKGRRPFPRPWASPARMSPATSSAAATSSCRRSSTATGTPSGSPPNRSSWTRFRPGRRIICRQSSARAGRRRPRSRKTAVLRAEIAVDNLAGHKLPSAYPSRRAWIHLTVLDGRAEPRSSNPAGSIPTARSPATTTTRTRALRAPLRRDRPAGRGPDLRTHPRRPRRPGDDGAPGRDPLPQGQPDSAVGLRQSDAPTETSP